MIRTLSIIIKSPIIQYFIALLLNCFYLLILTSNNVSYQNLQTPEGIYSENLWRGSDVLTYVRPARNFVQYRIFGYGTTPDYRRTVGYPLFLSTLMVLFGDYWLMFTLFTQAAIFAVVYPLLTRISRILYNANDNVVIFSFIFLILAGTYIVRVPMILTDTFFSVFFMLGLWLGLESLMKKSYIYLGLHIICLGYAAQVRPLLSLYPVVNCFILTATAKKYGLAKDTKALQIIVISVASLLIICNLASIRNYVNHGFSKPTDIFSSNMLNELGKSVLTSVGRTQEYKEIHETVNAVKDLTEKTLLQEKLAIKIYKDYPLVTLTQLVRSAILIMARSHWSLSAGFWGYSYKDDFSHEQMPLRKSTIVFFIEAFFNLIYLLVYFLFACFLVRILRSNNLLLFSALVLYISYFLLPAFILRWGGSRMRLPVEGLMVIMAFNEFEYYFNLLKNELFQLISNIVSTAKGYMASVIYRNHSIQLRSSLWSQGCRGQRAHQLLGPRIRCST